MEREDLVSPRMTGMWIAVTAVWLSMLNADYGLGLDLIQVLGGGVLFAAAVQLWDLRTGSPVMDERKKRLLTESMAWAFVVTSIGVLVASRMANEPLDAMRDVLELGFWTWLVSFSGKSLWQRYGKG
ncbi:MAG: hypothetical protein ABEK01_03480 [Candidatus Nanohaloarchaea archaeon]